MYRLRFRKNIQCGQRLTGISGNQNHGDSNEFLFINLGFAKKHRGILERRRFMEVICIIEASVFSFSLNKNTQGIKVVLWEVPVENIRGEEYTQAFYSDDMNHHSFIVGPHKIGEFLVPLPVLFCFCESIKELSEFFITIGHSQFLSPVYGRIEVLKDIRAITNNNRYFWLGWLLLVSQVLFRFCNLFWGKLGINIEDEGTLSIDSDKLRGVAENSEDIASTFSTLKDFSNSMMKKSAQVSLDPMQYVNRKIVAYKNPGHNLTSPYTSSIYSGMMFNFSC